PVSGLHALAHAVSARLSLRGRGVPVARRASPTRRSSDLALMASKRAWSLPETCEGFFDRRGFNTAMGAPSREASAVEKTLTGFRDRKSTRLNSSHVSISYAGFCLKTKNTRHDGADDVCIQ